MHQVLVVFAEGSRGLTHQQAVFHADFQVTLHPLHNCQHAISPYEDDDKVRLPLHRQLAMQQAPVQTCHRVA